MIDIEVDTDAPTDAWRKIVDTFDLKLHMRMLSDALDPVVESCIKSSIDTCDFQRSQIRRCILPRTFKFYRPAWPDRCDGVDKYPVIRLPFPPCIQIISVSYMDAAGAPQTLSTSAYILRKPEDAPAEIVMVDALNLPQTKEHPRAVTVQFKAGYGHLTSPPVPPMLQQLVKLYGSHFFENPEATVNEPRIILMNRAVDFGVTHLTNLLAIPHEYREWQ